MLARDLKVNQIIIQSDAKVVVDCINGICGVAALDHVAEDCRVLFKSFQFVSLLFFSREFNVDAHNVVELGKLYGF